MQVLKIREIKTGDEYFYPLTSMTYWSYCKNEQHLFIMAIDCRSNKSYSAKDFTWQIVKMETESMASTTSSM